MDKYSYKKWVQGVPMPKHLYLLIAFEDIDDEDAFKIISEQNEAYLKHINSGLEALKESFWSSYDRSFIKHEFLDIHIKKVESVIVKTKSENPEVYDSALYNNHERLKLTREKVERFLSPEQNEQRWEYEGFTILDDFNVDDAPLLFILKSNYLQWLIWFREQNKLDNTEPTINPILDMNLNEIGGLAKESKQSKSYKWLNSPETDLPELYQLLMENELIHSGTKEEQFKAVFKAKPLREIEPIKWHDDNASELIYFILQLQGSDGSLIEKEERLNYKRLKDCFITPNGEPFTKNLRQAKDNVRRYGISEAGRQKIDNIIQQFY